MWAGCWSRTGPERGFGIYERYAKDILRDASTGSWSATTAGSDQSSPGLVFFLGGSPPSSRWAAPAQALQFGASLLIWGVFVRTVVVWHITWSVNSVTHLWGYRNYDTDDDSRNNLFVGIISNGEGWHNNHHADPAPPGMAIAGGSWTSPI